MFGLGVPEIVVILIAFGVFFFGSEKLGDFARSLGRFSGEYKKGKLEIQDEIEKIGKEVGESAKRR